MAGQAQIWSVVLMCLASVAVGGRMIAQEGGSACKSQNVKTVTYITPGMTARPGQVHNKFWVAEVPEGHVGIKGVNAEIVDANGASVPLTDVYLHHWALSEFATPKEDSQKDMQPLLSTVHKHREHGMHLDASTVKLLREKKLINFFGKGGETRKTFYKLPGPYALEAGQKMDDVDIVWMINAHGLDTRGVADRMGCTECRCNLYNVTLTPDGAPLPEGYLGGQWCCGDGYQCTLEEGFNAEERTFHLKYVIDYVEWDECVVPVYEIGIEVTDPDSLSQTLLEFKVDGCGNADPTSEECVDTRVDILESPMAGEVVNIFSHLHASTFNATVWGEDGRFICATTPWYGTGNEVGNESGYIVGIQSCYGHPGTPNSIKVKKGEKLKYIVRSTKVGGPHTGLMAFLRVNLIRDGDRAAY